MSVRIQKSLADAGCGSRREIERLIVTGRITVDGRPARIGEPLDGTERVCIDGRPVNLAADPRRANSFVAYYSPGGEPGFRGTRDERQGGLPPPRRGRWLPIAPLEPNTMGLSVLTTDGVLADRLARARHELEREFSVRIVGRPKSSQLEQLIAGVALETGRAKIEAVEACGGAGQNVWYRMLLRDTRSRDLRPMLRAVGLTVSRIVRTRYGPIALGELRRGASRELTQAEIAALLAR